VSSATISTSLPLLVLAVTSLAVMIAIAIKRNHLAVAVISFLGFAVSFLCLWPAYAAAPVQITSLLIVDRFALVYMGLLLAASAAVVLLSFPYLNGRSEHKEEFYLLLVLATLGSMVLTATMNSAALFLGLELLSISLYALISYPRTEALSLEAGIKYLILAASSSAFLLFGLALLYIVGGSLALGQPTSLAESGARVTYLAGIVLVLTGIGFKLAVVPFHLWTPDVYQGAPLPAAAFVATVSKGGAFAFLLRWLHSEGVAWRPVLVVLAVVAVASMLIGNLLALRQTNMKRLLAYSSIAHMGYFLVAVIAGGDLGTAAATYYLAAYIVTILGTFGCLLALSDSARDTETFEDINGLFWRRPVLASVFSAMILSLAGIPLTAGFLGKFFVFAAGTSGAAWVLLIILIVSSTIGLAYYLRILVAMFGGTEGARAFTDERPPVGFAPATALVILTIMLFMLGVHPGPLWNAITPPGGAESGAVLSER